MTDIGKPKRIIEILPLPEEVPVSEPAEPDPVQVPERDPEQAPEEVPT